MAALEAKDQALQTALAQVARQVPEPLVGLGVVRHAPKPGPDVCFNQLFSSGSQANDVPPFNALEP
jgi:hypothetical protein